MDFKKLVKKRKTSDYLIYTLIILGSVALDQLTKFLAVKFLMPIDTFPIIEDVLHLTYDTNTGAAFGILKNAPWIFNSVTVITVLCLLLFLYLGHSPNMLYSISISMIIGGGIGNSIDRFTLEYVVDFIDFRLINFAIFNGADSFVCVGAGLLILAMVLDIIKEEREKRKAKK